MTKFKHFIEDMKFWYDDHALKFWTIVLVISLICFRLLTSFYVSWLTLDVSELNDTNYEVLTNETFKVDEILNAEFDGKSNIRLTGQDYSFILYNVDNAEFLALSDGQQLQGSLIRVCGDSVYLYDYYLWKDDFLKPVEILTEDSIS
jgi:hypothetical protein